MTDQPASAPAPRAPTWVFAFALFPLALGGFGLAVSDIVSGHRTLRWPTVNGNVLSSRLVPGGLLPAKPEIRYAYTVDGQPFVSNRVWPGGVLDLMPVRTSTAARVVERFAAGSSVTVHVNPGDFTDAALIPGPGRAYRWMGIFTFFVIVGFYAPFSWRRRERTRRTS